MKKTFLSLTVLLLTLIAIAQPPQHVSQTGAASNVFPFSTTSSNKTQVIYAPGDFTPSLAGGNKVISTMYIQADNVGTNVTLTNMTIKIGHSNLNVFTGNTWQTGLTQVYYVASRTFSSFAVGTWLVIPLQTPFVWDGVSNIIVEMSQTSYTGAGIYLLNQNATGNKRLHGGVAAATATNFATGQSKIGFDIIPDSCTGTPNASLITLTNAGSIVCGETATFSSTNTSTGLGLSNIWEKSEDGGLSWVTFATNATAPMLPNVVKNTRVRSITSCFKSGLSTTSNILNFSVVPIDFSLGSDTVICDNTTIDLSTAFYAPDSVLWDNNTTGLTRVVTQPGTYYASITLANTCKASDTIVIADGVEPSNPILANYNLCEDGSLQLNALNPGMTYLWSTNATNGLITVTQPGNYSVTITSGDLCKRTFNTTIIGRPKPIIALPSELTICSTDSIWVDGTATHGDTYAWSNNATTPAQFIKDEGMYVLTVNSIYGCEQRDTIYLQFKPDPLVGGYTFIPGFNNKINQVRFAPINPTNVISYHWDFGDGDSSVLPFPIHQYADFGTYHVQLVVKNDCSETSYFQTIELKDERVTSINEVNGSLITLYPNPTTGKVYFNTDIKIKSVLIYSIDGRMLSDLYFQGNEIDVSHLIDGAYLLKILINDGTESTQKLFIRK